MAKVVRDGDRVRLELSFMEKLGAFHWATIETSVDSITSISKVDRAWTRETIRGVRAPGTAFPYVIALGTMRHRRGKDFVAIYFRRPAWVIEIDGRPFKRWVLTSNQNFSLAELGSAL